MKAFCGWYLLVSMDFYLQVVEAVPALPEIPLPAIQPNYRPLPSIDVTPLSPQRRKGNTLSEILNVSFIAHWGTSAFARTLFSHKQTAFLCSVSTSVAVHSLFLLSVPVCNEEEDVGFTGKRLNSKMVVFSGSKTSYLPRMMTLYEQCIRVLQNNIDCEWGFFILYTKKEWPNRRRLRSNRHKKS